MRSLRALWFLVPVVLALVGLYAVISWLKKKDQVAVYEVDRIHRDAPMAAQRIAHGNFRLAKSQKFSFIVPPHVLSPRLSGEFSTFVPGADGSRSPDRSEGVELVLLDESQYRDFAGGRSARSLYFGDPSRKQDVNIALPATSEDPVRYYVVFQRASDEKSPLSVKADLSVKFDSAM